MKLLTKVKEFIKVLKEYDPDLEIDFILKTKEKSTTTKDYSLEHTMLNLNIVIETLEGCVLVDAKEFYESEEEVSSLEKELAGLRENTSYLNQEVDSLRKVVGDVQKNKD